MNLESLKLLPVEILEHIFSYLKTAEIVKLSKVCDEFENLSHNTKLVRNVDFFNEHNLNCCDILSFLCLKPRCVLITTLNINCIYWIPAADIRKCLPAMISLECLYAVDTKLGLIKSDITTYRQIPKLRRLGVSASNGTFCIEDLLPLPNITHLYLFLHSDVMRHLVHMLHKFDVRLLEELWLVEFGKVFRNLATFSFLPTSIKKFTSVLNNAIYSNLNYSLKCWFNTMNGIQQSLDDSIQVDVSYETFEAFGDKNWIHLLKLFMHSCPFSVKQSKELFCKTQTLKSINFDEINFRHGDITCGPLYIDVVDHVLLYENMKALKKLSLGFCACLENEDDISFQQQKRQKLNNDVPKSNCLLQKINENSQYLEELELWSCQRADNSRRITNASLGTIANFQYLKKLTLYDIPIHINASFLIDVLSSCQCLSSIRIKSRKQNSSLHNMFCISLTNATSLKDIRYEHPGNISIDKFFEALTRNKNLKLERLFVKCESVEVLSVKPLQEFIKFQPDLRFFYIVIETLPKTVIKEIRNSLAHYMSDRRKVFVVGQDECNYKGKVSIPLQHAFEMIKCKTNISVLDVFNYFAI